MRALHRSVLVVLAAMPLTAGADPAPIAPVAAPAAIQIIDNTPSFELRDRGDAVEVIAHHIKAVRTAILPMRSRLEIPIATGPAAKRVMPGDATVKLIELDGVDANRMLSVKLGFERLDVRTLARYAQAIQVGDDLHVIVPRKVPIDGFAPRLPEPTLPPALAAAVAKLDPPAILGPRLPEAKPATKPAPAPTVLGPSLPTPAVAHAEAKPAPAQAAKPASADKPLKQILAPEPDDAWSKISMYGALGLAAIGAGIWLMRRRKGGNIPAHSSIEILAQRSLGGKARIVWLSAGQREMIVSVTAQQVRMLGQWRKTDAAGGSTAQPAQDSRPDARNALIDRLVEHDRGSHDQPAAEQPDNLSLAHHLPRTERRTGQLAVPGQFTMPERRTGAYAAVAKPGERRTGSLAAVDGPAERAPSAAVSGILRLRGRTGQMPAVSDEVATGDVEADELWAREILAATGARR